MKRYLYRIKFIVDDESSTDGTLELMDYSSGIARFTAEKILRDNCTIIAVYPIAGDSNEQI